MRVRKLDQPDDENPGSGGSSVGVTVAATSPSESTAGIHTSRAESARPNGRVPGPDVMRIAGRPQSRKVTTPMMQMVVITSAWVTGVVRPWKNSPLP